MKILILHGWGHTGRLWDNIAKKFGKDTQSIDLPGFGEEPLVSADWGVPEYALWVENKIKNEKEIILIGHSFGGRIAAEIASKRPIWLKLLVLSGAPCLRRPEFKIRLKIFLYKILKRAMPSSFRKLFYSDGLKNSQIRGMESVFRRVVVYDQERQLRNINVSTLLIWGKNDIEVPVKIAEEMAQIIPKSQLSMLEGTGHNLFLEKPELFYGIINKFILENK